jgi:excisionase family DNA binding protein
MEKLYSINDAAEALGGVSRMTIETWLSRGRLRRTKVGRRTMIRESELQRFLDEDATQQAKPLGDD